MKMRIEAKEIKGEIRIRKNYDVRVDSKTGQKADVSPVICMCCHKEVFKVSELVNGDILGSVCDGLAATPVFRIGRTLNQKQANYFRTKGML
jgi:hypothetical protein